MLQVANRNIKIKNCIIREEWQRFRTFDQQEVSLQIMVCKELVHYYNVEFFPVQPRTLILKCRNALLSADKDWSHACVTLLDGKEDGLEGALIAAIMTHLSIRHGLMMHSSLIDYSGRGLMFVGPSGIGKTTQAELWMKYRDAVIINGDMALVKEEEHLFTGYGCPWHGSSPYCENRQVPLCGIIVLEQDKENSIERLSGIAMIERMMRNIFLPQWYEEGIKAALETVDHLLSSVPVYLLRCRPDAEAVEITERTLFGEDG